MLYPPTREHDDLVSQMAARGADLTVDTGIGNDRVKVNIANRGGEFGIEIAGAFNVLAGPGDDSAKVKRKNGSNAITTSGLFDGGADFDKLSILNNVLTIAVQNWESTKP